MKCPKCQTENPEEAIFCIQCGARIAEEVSLTCPSCGIELPAGAQFCFKCGHSLAEPAQETATASPVPPSPEPTSFAGGRYQVKRLLGEGGKKKVYLVHDNTLDRDVAFALIKTEKLDGEARARITREAQAMGRLGDHPNVMGIHDMGEEGGQPYIVIPLMPGGDVEGLIERAPEHRLPLEQAIGIAKAVCQGLEFAHTKGIIHRDLKPGNVWLSADGTAKIGDFGLAVAVDLSRLTQSGMMVGTVSYMPPEQAMGGKVTPKADLYSLGAMLYEMVTGRPPFIGDDSVAIIGQHINTSVVSPTWHRADLPPGLEVLILQLLEKDPDKRPASASDVLKALESIEQGKVTEPVSQVTATPESPLYRRVFVGREPEQKQLQAAFDGAMSGQGALMMVVGEPGIGKTALCEQLSTYVTLRGGKMLVGHCYEEGSLSLPYLAFVEAMRSYVLSRETRDLRKELGTGAADVARIVSEVREKLKVEPRPPESPEEERYRLMQAVTSFLTNAAKVQPLLIVLEDLHDSDKGTLEMLTHVSRNLSGARLLLVGTYRDVEVDRTHPLSAALAELRRVATFNRVLLRGLNADEVRRMLESITRQDVPWGLAEAVHRQTEGNPLFVQEVVRYLVEEGLISREGGQWKATTLEMSIPEGLRDVVGKRLSGLSQECNRILSIASVIGREFRLAVLQKVADVSDDELFAALEEAKGAAVVEERSTVGAAVTYRFTHAFFRQTLYEEIIAPRRIRLHQQVGRALEEVYEKRLEEHAAELAEHFSYSPDAEGLAKAVSYGEMAAERASSVYAYSEAVRLLEQALKVQEVLDPENKTKRCELLLALSEALCATMEPRRLLEKELPELFSLAETIKNNEYISLACIFAIRALIIEGQAAGVRTPEAVLWAERADQYARPDTVERAVADACLGAVRFATRNWKSARELLDKAVEQARRLGDPETFWATASIWIGYSQAPHHFEKATSLAGEIIRAPRPQRLETASVGFRSAALAFLPSGQRQPAQECCDELRNLYERTGHNWCFFRYLTLNAVMVAIDGRLEEAVDIGRQMISRGQELGIPILAFGQARIADLRPRLYLGRNLERFEQAYRDGLQALGMQPDAELCLINAYLGRSDNVEEILERMVVKRPYFGTTDDETQVMTEMSCLEAAVLVGHRQAAEMLLKRFAGSNVCTTGENYTTCVPRHLGAAAVLLGRPEEARQHYAEALEVATNMRFRPELALTRLQLAELLLEHYPDEKKEALEHLDFAINEFREMKMQPSLERALRHKEILGA
ncbi:MAG TPA: protein kinase [Dehalococcoidia bacterium]|nr:protein kinase [Dehalococcoidia bacterium]